jgi:hypothetical protein
MSVSSRNLEVNRCQKDLADLEKKLAEESKKEASKYKEQSQIERSITKGTSLSTLHSKQDKINRIMTDIASIQIKKAELRKKIAEQTDKLGRAKEQLTREEKSERKKITDIEKRREAEQIRHQRAITNELRSQYTISNQIANSSINENSDVDYDAFISHASEDKESFVKPLVSALIDKGYRIWYDEFELKVGDSLRRSIDNGLKKSKYGIVVLSASFFAKNWPQYELDGLVNKEMNGHKVILPIWHMVSKNQVQSYSPSLSDKVAINSSISTIDEIVIQLSEVLTQHE